MYAKYIRTHGKIPKKIRHFSYVALHAFYDSAEIQTKFVSFATLDASIFTCVCESVPCSNRNTLQRTLKFAFFLL